MKPKSFSGAHPQELLDALLSKPSKPITKEERAALERLIRIAQADTGQSKRVANFLLAWWNADSCGSFDLSELWVLDDAITMDMTAVFAFIARVNTYPDSLGYSADFETIIQIWRPGLTGTAGA